MKRCKRLKSDLPELPDCVISYIFSKLSLKDSMKTCTLSKRWLHEWRYRMDLNFDFHNMFDFDLPNMSEFDDNTIMQKLLESLPLFESEFYTRLDQFMLHHQGTMISSIRLNFPLGNEHKDVIDRLITKGVAKGVKHIELLFSYIIGDTDFILKLMPYKFSFTLLSDTDSLRYLRLQNCHLVAPMEFSGLKNLRTLVLKVVSVKQDMLHGLLPNCVHLVNIFLVYCTFKSDLKVISASLLHLTIYCGSRPQRKRNIDIIASNLSSFQYYFENDYGGHTMNIKAPMLTEFSYESSHISKPGGFFSGLKNVTTIKLIGLRECLQHVVMPLLFSECLQLKNVTFIHCWIKSDLNIINSKLCHLKLINCGWKELYPRNIYIDALNLSSFEYSGYTLGTFYVNAPMLLKVFWKVLKSEKNHCEPFRPIARLCHIETLSMVLSPSQISKLKRALVRFQNLRQLKLFMEGAYDRNKDYFWILDIAMVSQYLQKISLTVRNSHMENLHMVGSQRQRTKCVGFSHDNLKYVELCGSVCTINVIDLASHLLRNVNSLEQVTFSSCDKFYRGAEKWFEDSHSCWFDRNLIYEMLKDDIKDGCQLKIL